MGKEKARIEALEKKILEASGKYAKLKGYALNADRRIVKAIVHGLALNEQKYGLRYCPCVALSGDAEKDKIYICPCRAHAKDIEEKGMCYCRLFVKK